MGSSVAKFTKKQIADWKAYEKVRVSGITNMFMVNVVCDYSGLTREEALFCMKNYSELKERVGKKN